MNTLVELSAYARAHSSHHSGDGRAFFCKLTMGDNTFFLGLTFQSSEPYVKKCASMWTPWNTTDLLNCRGRCLICYGMQLLRRYCRPHALRVPSLALAGLTVLEDVMPIVYTVRTQNQAGTYPDDDAGIAKMFDMLQWGLRAGVEVLDVESAWDVTKTKALLDKAEERYSSKFLESPCGGKRYGDAILL
jgi:hypothetical protein